MINIVINFDKFHKDLKKLEIKTYSMSGILKSVIEGEALIITSVEAYLGGHAGLQTQRMRFNSLYPRQT